MSLMMVLPAMEKTITFVDENGEIMNYPIGNPGLQDAYRKILQAFYADGDYQLMGSLEVYFQNSLMVLFRLMGFYVQVERHTSRGRMDVTIQTRDYVYILELKVDKTAEEALRQIEEKQFAAPFATDPRKLFKIGVCFSSEERGVSDWKVE